MAAASLVAFLRHLKQVLAPETLTLLTDRRLLQQFVDQHDATAFEEIMRRHGPMVFRVCRRVLPQVQDAEDAFQATFLVLARKARSIRREGSLASWLHGVAYRVSLKARARAVRRRHCEEQATDLIKAASPEHAPWGELRAVLDAELKSLAAKWRNPLVLCYLEGRTQEEAARELGWSKSTLRRRLE